MLNHGGRQRVSKCGVKGKEWADVVTQIMVI